MTSVNNIIKNSELTKYDPFQLQTHTHPADKSLRFIQQFITTRYVSQVDPLKPVSEIKNVTAEIPLATTHIEVNHRIDSAYQRAGLSDRNTLLECIKMHRESLIAFKNALTDKDANNATKISIFNALPESIIEILCYLVWYEHGCPQSHNYGHETIIEDFSILSHLTKPYLHHEGGDIIGQLIRSIDDKIQILESVKIITQLNKLKQCCENNFSNQSLLQLLHALKGEVQGYLHGEIYTYVPGDQFTKQRNAQWGKETLEADVTRLITAKTYYNLSVLDQAIKNYKDELDSRLDNHKKLERMHFEQLVDGNFLNHRTLHKIYKCLAPEEKVKLAARYHPPYYGKGINANLHHEYGAHILNHGHVMFKVYAPNAKNVAVVITENGKDIKAIPMVKTTRGNWELETDQAKLGTTYQYQITSPSNEILRKADPFSRFNKEQTSIRLLERNYDNSMETIQAFRGHESVITKSTFEWTDDAWLAERAEKAGKEIPRNIYELHVSHWKRDEDGKVNWVGLAKELVLYCKKMHFTHVELMSVLDHLYDEPFTGYQPVAFFAPNHRLGTLDEFKAFVNYLHKHGIGIILDWIPGHFGRNDSGLMHFDGTTLYEHNDPKRSTLIGWHVICFDHEQARVCNFLHSNAKFWVEEYHIDGLRVDAVPGMLRTDEFRNPSLPHYKGGVWNRDGMTYLRDFNAFIHKEHPGVFTISEECMQQVGNTYPPTQKIGFFGNPMQRGLGFDEKWGMPWMSAMVQRKKSLLYESPEHRRYHRDRLYGAMKYDYDNGEIVTRQISHDEWGEKENTLLDLMQGELKYPVNSASKFADLRALYAQQMCLPGSKLSFMGNDFAQTESWSNRAFYATGRQQPLMTTSSFQKQLEHKICAVAWEQIVPGSPHETHQQFVAALNKLYLNEPALWERHKESMQWFHTADFDSNEGRPLVAYFRKSSEDPNSQLICINNFGDNDEKEYVITFPALDTNPHLADLTSIEEIFNTDDIQWGGEGRTNQDRGIELIRNDNRLIGFKLRIAPQSGIVLKLHFLQLLTKLSVKCQVPPDHTLFIRGSGEGLCWEKGVPLVKDAEDTWVIPLHIRSTISFKILLDDNEWETGDDHTLIPEKHSTIQPYFESQAWFLSNKRPLALYEDMSSAQNRYFREEEAGLSWRPPFIPREHPIIQPRFESQAELPASEHLTFYGEAGSAQHLYFREEEVSLSLPLSLTSGQLNKKRLTFYGDVGSAQHLYFRGEGAGLSWHQPIPLSRDSHGVWFCELDLEDSSHVEFKILKEDQIWENGPNHELREGQKLEFQLQF